MDPTTFSLMSGSDYYYPINFVGSVLGTSISAGVTSVTFTGHSTGDLLLAVGATSSTTKPTITAGWTEILTFTNDSPFLSRCALMAYRFAPSSADTTLTFTGSGTSAGEWSSGMTFRNVSSIGASAKVDNTANSATTTIATPALTLSVTNGSSALALFAFRPYISASPGSLIITNGMAYGLEQSTWPAGNMTTSSNQPPISAIVELVRGQ